jgi:class 3 adenylate cyclase
MRCTRCGADSLAGMKFRGQCGLSLDALGPWELVAPDPDKATPETVRTLPGEMKQVTVLFCDIVNSTQ